MKALQAIVVGVAVSSLVACRSAKPATQSIPPLTVYVAPRAVAPLADRILGVAARNGWTVSLRTDSAALTEYDLAILDSGGRFVAHVRDGSQVHPQAHELAASLELR